jgi:two-component system, NarL family, nitrate/nitrite response regulator NarL
MLGSVLVADDHAVVRGGVRADLEELGYRVCAEAGDADGAVEAALREQPDICLLDISMPGGGIAAARAIAMQLPETRVVMFTISRDDDDIRAAIEAGAVGYVLKDVDLDKLAEALESVVAGRIVTPFRANGPL